MNRSVNFRSMLTWITDNPFITSQFASSPAHILFTAYPYEQLYRRSMGFDEMNGHEKRRDKARQLKDWLAGCATTKQAIRLQHNTHTTSQPVPHAPQKLRTDISLEYGTRARTRSLERIALMRSGCFWVHNNLRGPILLYDLWDPGSRDCTSFPTPMIVILYCRVVTLAVLRDVRVAELLAFLLC